MESDELVDPLDYIMIDRRSRLEEVINNKDPTYNKFDARLIKIGPWVIAKWASFWAYLDDQEKIAGYPLLNMMCLDCFRERGRITEEKELVTALFGKKLIAKSDYLSYKIKGGTEWLPPYMRK